LLTPVNFPQYPPSQSIFSSAQLAAASADFSVPSRQRAAIRTRESGNNFLNMAKSPTLFGLFVELTIIILKIYNFN
jgi:hypothetical protein